MDNINDIISSLTPDDIEALKQTAESIFGSQSSQSTQSSQSSNQNQGSGGIPFGMDFGSMLDPEMFSRLGKIMGAMNSDGGARCKLIEALKPNLSSRRQKKADEAMQILKLLEVIPLITSLTDRGD